MHAPRLDEELDKGELDELPPSRLPGFLGERGPDMRKVDTYEYGMSAGLLQEQTAETRFLTVLLLYVLVVTSPIAVYLLWRDKHARRWTKVAWTVVMASGLVALVWSVASRW